MEGEGEGEGKGRLGEGGRGGRREGRDGCIKSQVLSYCVAWPRSYPTLWVCAAGLHVAKPNWLFVNLSPITSYPTYPPHLHIPTLHPTCPTSHPTHPSPLLTPYTFLTPTLYPTHSSPPPHTLHIPPPSSHPTHSSPPPHTLHIPPPSSHPTHSSLPPYTLHIPTSPPPHTLHIPLTFLSRCLCCKASAPATSLASSSADISAFISLTHDSSSLGVGGGGGVDMRAAGVGGT